MYNDGWILLMNVELGDDGWIPFMNDEFKMKCFIFVINNKNTLYMIFLNKLWIIILDTYFGMVWTFFKYATKYTHFKNEWIFTNNNHTSNELL
jgi:hypothetical protein